MILLVTTPLLAAELTFSSKEADGLEVWFMNQPIDPQNPNLGHFQQKVLIDRTHAAGPESPVILEIGGEWALGTANLSTVAIAKKNHAIIVSLEHRYYGDSQPYQGNLSTEQLKHLTTANALADLKNAIETLRSEQNMNGRWITAGCSYGGTLAAYLKATSPELIVGSIAFSAPVKAATVWPGLDTFISKSMGQDCATKTKSALESFTHKVKSMTDADFQNLRTRLHILNTTSREAFMEIPADTVRTFSQQGQIQDFCDVLDPKDEESLNILIEWAVTRFGIDAYSYDTVGDVQMKDSGSLIRQWVYQTCTELGWFQINAGENGVLPSAINKDHYAQFCAKHFGIIQLPDVTTFNTLYYEKVLQADSILFLNSKLDGWSDLSIRPDNKPSDRITAIEYEGGSHCSAMWDDFTLNHEPSSPLGQQIMKVAESWLMPSHQTKP